MIHRRIYEYFSTYRKGYWCQHEGKESLDHLQHERSSSDQGRNGVRVLSTRSLLLPRSGENLQEADVDVLLHRHHNFVRRGAA